MKLARLKTSGGAKILVGWRDDHNHQAEDIPGNCTLVEDGQPARGPDELPVRIRASSLNFHDDKR